MERLIIKVFVVTLFMSHYKHGSRSIGSRSWEIKSG